MFSKVLVGTSLSETSTEALCYLKNLQQASAREIVLAHVMDVRDVGGLYDQLRRLAQPVLEKQKQALEAMGYTVETEIALGIPYYEINRLAREKGASLIAVHVTTTSLLEDAFVGGVTYEVIQRAEKPVLVMKAKLGEGACELLCREILTHIIHPTDFSDNAERAFTYVENLMESGCTTVTLLHVQEQGRIDDARLSEFNEIDRARLERLKEKLLAKGARQVDIVIPYGSPTAEILKATRENSYSLMVMGSQGRGFLAELFLGSVSHNMVRKAPVPVLLVPRQ